MKANRRRGEEEVEQGEDKEGERKKQKFERQKPK